MLTFRGDIHLLPLQSQQYKSLHIQSKIQKYTTLVPIVPHSHFQKLMIVHLSSYLDVKLYFSSFLFSQEFGWMRG